MKGCDVPRAILAHWYQCGRKIRFEANSPASAAASTAPGLHAYQCPFGDDGHWHVGRPQRDMSDRPRWRPRDERRRQLRNAAKTWDRIAYRR